MSLFIRVDCSFYTHRKTRRLQAAIGSDALWIPPRLWAYAAEHHPDGSLSDYTAEELALAIGFQGDATSMLQALLAARFLDDDPLRIHDWSEHNGYHQRYAERAQKAAQARWQKERAKEKDGEKGEERRGEEASNACSMLAASGRANGCTTPNSLDNGSIPTFEEVLTEAGMRGIPETSARSFFDHHQDNSLWLNQFNRLIDWRKKLKSWANKDRSQVNSRGIRPDHSKGF